MPLLTSPIDGSPMRQIHRYGVEFDVCPTSCGIWLDKGELEKILHMLQEEVATEQSNFKPSKHHMRHEHDYDDDRKNYEKMAITAPASIIKKKVKCHGSWICLIFKCYTKVRLAILGRAHKFIYRVYDHF